MPQVSVWVWKCLQVSAGPPLQVDHQLADFLEARFWTTSRLPSIHQFLNTSVFSEERPSRDDEQYNYVVLAKAADLRDARQRMKLDRYHPHPLDFAGFRLPTRCAKLLNRSHGGPRTR
jgi:hypothetical protein